MTDRYNALVVVLDRDIREDDAEHLINAIKMIKGVVDVTGNVSSPGEEATAVRIKRDMVEKMYGLIAEINKL